MHREKFPEQIPFRLTRMLTNAMEVSGIEGNFRNTCENVMRVLRENKESLMAVLEAFVYDPLINWRILTTSPRQRKYFGHQIYMKPFGRQTFSLRSWRSWMLNIVPSLSPIAMGDGQGGNQPNGTGESAMDEQARNMRRALPSERELVRDNIQSKIFPPPASCFSTNAMLEYFSQLTDLSPCFCRLQWKTSPSS